ncbi:hypothetical protein HS048_35085 [Planomonospora sp. ID91781]|uniref:hypothetical protein n=1 Tax=Planomonospora sp. ID91781 TaxID=2738135 RepID=UPI0018C3B040|nr:hypothetical protein [Planomonospora sp. ID91781]MBG0825900.1 hypothetical protein [Planomonospora sp. ID91781]
MDHSSSLAADTTSSGTGGVAPAPSTVGPRRCGIRAGRRASALAVWMQVADVLLQRRADDSPVPVPATFGTGLSRTPAPSPFSDSCPLQLLDRWSERGRISPVVWEYVTVPTSPQAIFSVTVMTVVGWGRACRSVVGTATGASMAAARRAAATALVTQLKGRGRDIGEVIR